MLRKLAVTLAWLQAMYAYPPVAHATTIAALGAVTYPGGQGMVPMNLYLYGDQAAGTVARETPLWQAWFHERFPMPMELSKSE